MAAGSPATPAPITTTSADLSQLCGEALWASAPCTLAAVKAMPAAPVDRKVRRLTSPEAAPSRSVVFLPIFPSGRLRARHPPIAAAFTPRPLAGRRIASAITLIPADNLDSAGGRVKTAV